MDREMDRRERDREGTGRERGRERDKLTQPEYMVT